jgi:cytochrome c oxidase accessory protein FixG
LIANTFLSYIVGVEAIYKMIHEPIRDHIGVLMGLLLFTIFFYITFAFVRDLVCTTICPYGRLQGVLFDKDTTLIAYDYERGEPRGNIKKDVARTEGDCIDCKKCVFVCPTGIDIRDGIQMECVGCTACIDACDEVMVKVGFRKGLIRYASENQIAEKSGFIFNNRMKAYTVLLIGLIAFNGFLISTRKHYDIFISRAQGQLYQELDNGNLSNLYEGKIINKTNKDIIAHLDLIGIPGSIKIIGSQEIKLKKESLNEVTFFIEIPKNELKQRSTSIELKLSEGSTILQKVKTNFLGMYKS